VFQKYNLNFQCQCGAFSTHDPDVTLAPFRGDNLLQNDILHFVFRLQ